MNISSTQEGVTALVRMAGRLDGEAALQVADTLDRLLREGRRSVVLDMSGVTYLSLPGTLVLQRADQEYASAKGELHALPRRRRWPRRWPWPSRAARAPGSLLIRTPRPEVLRWRRWPGPHRLVAPLCPQAHLGDTLGGLADDWLVDPPAARSHSCLTRANPLGTWRAYRS